jgi:hypothetical protein
MRQAAWSDVVVTLIRLQEGIARRRGQDVGEHNRRNHDDEERDDDGETSEVGAESDDESFHISCSERRTGERIRHRVSTPRLRRGATHALAGE